MNAESRLLLLNWSAQPESSPGSVLSNPLLTNATLQFKSATGWTFDERVHLLSLRTSGARLPLFCCVPGAPGVRDLADILPTDQPVYEFRYPDISGASNFPAVDELATTYLQSLRKIQKKGPYQLCGYSKAGLVAYEMARLLLSQGENVSFLALFETWHPGYHQNLSFLESVQFRILYIVDRLGKYGRNLVQGRFSDAAAHAREMVVKRVKLLGWRATRFIRRSGRPVPKSMEAAETLVALKAFVPKPYPRRFMLIRTEDRFEKRLRDQTFGWHVCAPEGVDVHFIPGDQDHGTMLRKPFVRGVVEKIAPYLADPQMP